MDILHFTRWSRNTHQEKWAIMLQFCCKLATVALCQILSKYNTVWQSYCKNKRVQFFEWLCRLLRCWRWMLLMLVFRMTRPVMSCQLRRRWQHISLAAEAKMFSHMKISTGERTTSLLLSIYLSIYLSNIL